MVINQLGSGAYGTVYEVKHRSSKKVYAAKYLKIFTCDSKLAQYTYREVAILKHLSNMGSANCFTSRLKEIVVAGDKDTFSSIFLVMEKMPLDLRSLFGKQDIYLEEEHGLIMIYNILCGINFLHTANIMHRDIKPANILTDQECTIKICDFGMAITIRSKKDDSDTLAKKETSLPLSE